MPYDKTQHAVIGWTVDDIMAEATEYMQKDMTEDEARKFLERYSSRFEELAIEKGWEIWRDLMDEYYKEKEKNG